MFGFVGTVLRSVICLFLRVFVLRVFVLTGSLVS
jgi:hypothetical protein